jgi:FtsP/CotA-like multicopper oxidase with cupredoxin domain
MGNRVDLEFTMPASGSVKLIESQNLQNFTIGQGTDPTIPNLNTLPAFSYLSYGVPTADPRLPKTTFDAEYTLNLGGDLSINGKLFPNVPDMVVKKGQLTKITYVNNSTLTHPMHIHGQFYSVLKVNGVPVTGSPIHMDTVIVKPGETVEVAVLADNEGIWMLHCHVLEHAAGGMMMFNSYDNVYSPYKVGSGTGNDPH